MPLIVHYFLMMVIISFECFYFFNWIGYRPHVSKIDILIIFTFNLGGIPVKFRTDGTVLKKGLPKEVNYSKYFFI